jgi:hypothetical protein
MTAKVTRIEDPEPIRVHVPGMNYLLTLKQAQRFLRELEKSVKAVERHFVCAHEDSWARQTIRCWSLGSVKIGKRYYCKRHAKRRPAMRAGSNAGGISPAKEAM